MNKFYKEHLQYVQNFWDIILSKGDIVIDATVGNGHDLLYLSQRVLTVNSGLVIGYDVQSLAIENSKKRLSESLSPSYLPRIKLFQKSHEQFNEIEENNIKLITYNLGYLPTSDKSIQTTARTTQLSIENAFKLNPKYISIICYSGHSCGLIEEKQVLNLLKTLQRNKYIVTWKQWINRKNFPSVFLIESKNLTCKNLPN